MRQGMSGNLVYRSGDLILKKTTGKESVARIRRDVTKQINSIGRIYPIASVPINKVECDEENFVCEMPDMGVDLGERYLTYEEVKIVRDQISKSLFYRKTQLRNGLNEILTEEIKRISSFVKEIYGVDEFNKVVDEFKEFKCESDMYLHGYCHGDLGLRNLFLVGKRVYATDFTHSFIQSPLVDVIMLKRSLCNDSKEHDILKQIYKDYSIYSKQMEAILKVKKLCWKYKA